MIKFNSDPCPYIRECPHKIQCAMEEWEFIDSNTIFDLADHVASKKGKKERDEFLISACYDFNNGSLKKAFQDWDEHNNGMA